MVEQEVTWVGLRIGDWEIEQLLGEGAFSSVYKANHANENRYAAIKAAKPQDLLDITPVVQSMPSQAVGFFTGGIQGVHPDTVALLSLQFEKLKAAADPALPAVEHLVAQNGFGYYVMEHIEGKTLRDIQRSERVPISCLCECARILDRLQDNRSFLYHADIKPENILISSGRVRLIDPGYFGELEAEEGSLREASITTPAYYPFMKPDDIFAFGLMLWELATGRHPLLPTKQQASEPRVSNELMQWLRSFGNVGLYFLMPLVELPLLSEVRPDLGQDVESFLLSMLGLRRDESQVLQRGPRIGSFAEIASALAELEADGLSAL